MFPDILSHKRITCNDSEQALFTEKRRNHYKVVVVVHKKAVYAAYTFNHLIHKKTQKKFNYEDMSDKKVEKQ